MLGLALLRYSLQVNFGLAFRQASGCFLPHSFQLVPSTCYPTPHIDMSKQLQLIGRRLVNQDTTAAECTQLSKRERIVHS
jgi:hypothetical protein